MFYGFFFFPFFPSVDLKVVDGAQTKSVISSANRYPTNTYWCKVQYGSTLDGSTIQPTATWYQNGGLLPPTVNKKDVVNDIDDLNKTLTSYLMITDPDPGVYECRFTWKGYNDSKKFSFTIIGT